MDCLFCGSSAIRKAAYPRPTRFNNKTFSYRKCADCDLIFIDPLPVAEDYDVMYAREYHSEFYFKDVAPDHTPLLELLESHVRTSTLVDYGCGDGSFVRFFSGKGYRCTGVEYDKNLVEELRAGIPEGQFLTVDEFWDRCADRYGVIYMGDVLEHLDKPATFLKKLYGKLEEGGLIMAQGPLENNNNLALRVRKMTSALVSLTGRKNASHIPYHISFSNAENQEQLFRENGFRTKEYKVYETTWPYPSRLQKKPVAIFQFMVAKASMFLTRSFHTKKGNRFIYIGEKKSS